MFYRMSLFKKITSLFLIFCFSLSLASCKGKKDESKEVLSGEMSFSSMVENDISKGSEKENSERSEVSEKTDNSDISESTQNSQNIELSENTQNSENGESVDYSENGDTSDSSENVESSETSETSDNSGNSDNSDNSDNLNNNESSFEYSSENSSSESSEINSEISSESSKENWGKKEATYFKDTGKCTYTTIYSPETKDKITYENNGLYLYNTEFRMSPELEDEFMKLFASFENPQSITVREMNSEFVFAYNPNKRIACASAIKAPFSLFITKAIEQGIVSWNEKLTYEKKYDYFEGSGVIQPNYKYGTKFSVKRLYELMLYVSDNIAYVMVKDRFGGASRFNDAMNAIGCKDIITSGNWGKLTSYEMALVWREIYFYTKNGSSPSKKLYTELDKALYNELEKGITGKANLHKSGWSANGYNDAGIFFDGEQAYSVAVMTGRTSLTDGRNATHLRKVAKLINKLMAEYKTYVNENQQS